MATKTITVLDYLKPKTCENYNKNKELLETIYKPKLIEEIIGKDTKDVVQNIIENILNHHRIHMIFGSSGCGKKLVCDLILSRLNYSPVYFDMCDTYQKNNFVERIKKILFIQNKNSVAIVIENVDNSIKDTLFNQIVKIVKRYDSDVLIICLSNLCSIPKLYQKNIIQTYQLQYPDEQSCVKYFRKILKAEQIKLTDYSLKYIIKHCNCHIRKIFQVLYFIKIMEDHDLKTIKSVLSITYADCFLTMSQALNKILKTKNVNNSSVNDQLIYSFTLGYLFKCVSFIKDINHCYNVSEAISFSDIMEKYMFKKQLWITKEYSKFVSCYTFKMCMNQKTIHIKDNDKQKSKRVQNNIYSRFPIKSYELNVALL